MTAIIIYCSLAWLRQECNQYLDVPPRLARSLPKQLQELIGYTRVHPTLGYFGAFTDPEEVLAGDAGAEQTPSAKI